MNKIKIILAEDSEVIAKVLQFKLKSEGMELIHYTSGEGVLPGIIQHKPDLVILDIMMPVKDGLQTLREIRRTESLKNLPVMLFSVNRSDKQIQEAKELGANDFLSKPYDPDELITKIHNLVKRD